MFLHYTHIDMKAINENCSAYHGGESKVLLSMNQMGAGHATDRATQAQLQLAKGKLFWGKTEGKEIHGNTGDDAFVTEERVYLRQRR